MMTNNGRVLMDLQAPGKEEEQERLAEEKQLEELTTETRNSTAGEGDRLKMQTGGSIRESFNLFSSYFRERGREKEGFGSGRASVEVYSNEMAQLGLFLKHNNALITGPTATTAAATTTQPSRFIAAQLQPPVQSCNHPPQLTIFFGGTVNVFDDIPSEKVQAILMLAAASAATTKNVDEPNASAVAVPALIRSPSLHSTSNQALPATKLPYPTTKTVPLCKSQSDLPIARRNSFQRFLDKRRDRLASKAPYPEATKEGNDTASAETSRDRLRYFVESEMAQSDDGSPNTPAMRS